MKKFAEAFGLAICATSILALSVFAIIAISPPVEKDCAHQNTVWKADSSEHWQECNDCKKEIPSSRSSHLLSYGHCDCEAYAEYIK